MPLARARAAGAAAHSARSHGGSHGGRHSGHGRDALHEPGHGRDAPHEPGAGHASGASHPRSQSPTPPGGSKWGRAVAGALREAEEELLQEVRASAEMQLAAQERAVQRFLQRLSEQGGCGGAGEPGAGPQGPGEVVRAEWSQGAAAEERGSATERTPSLGRAHTMEFYSDRMKETIRQKDFRDATEGIVVPKEQSSWLPPAAKRCYDFWASLREPERGGLLADVVQSNKFELATLVMIMLNGALVVLQTQRDGSIAVRDPIELRERGNVGSFDFVVEQMFTAYFTLELLLRLLVHRLYFFCDGDWCWNLFDTGTITVTLLDVFLTQLGGQSETMDANFLRLLRVFRMTRSLRILRALQFVRPLRNLMECMVSSLSGVIWSLVLIAFFTGIFATFLCQSLTSFLVERDPLEETTPEMAADLNLLREDFGTVQSAAFSLFKTTSGAGDWGEYYRILSHTGVVAPAVVLIYILFFIIAAWNIVSSLFLERALSIAKPDLDQQLLESRQQDIDDAYALMSILQEVDADGNGMVSLNEFKAYFRNPRVRAFCELRNIDIKDVETFFQMLQVAEDTDELELETLVNGLLRMRGLATNMDLQALVFQVHLQSVNNQLALDGITRELGGISRKLQSVPTSAAPPAREPDGFAPQDGKSGSAVMETPRTLGQYIRGKLMDAPPVVSIALEQDDPTEAPPLETHQTLGQYIKEKLMDAPPYVSSAPVQDAPNEALPLSSKWAQEHVGPPSEALKLVQEDIINSWVKMTFPGVRSPGRGDALSSRQARLSA